MLCKEKKAKLTGLIVGVLLTACSAATGIGAGCSAYFEAWTTVPPPEVMAEAPLEVVNWLNLLDKRMVEVCK